MEKKVFKYFIGYEVDPEKIMPLCILVPKMSVYTRKFDETKYMYVFQIKDDDLQEKYNEILDNVSKVIKAKFVSKPV